MDEDNAFDYKSPRKDQPKVGSIERGHKHDIEHTATGRKVTRRHDEKGISAGTDDEESGEKRGRGRPKGTNQRLNHFDAVVAEGLANQPAVILAVVSPNLRPHKTAFSSTVVVAYGKLPARSRDEF